MKPQLILCVAFVLAGGLAGCSTITHHPTEGATISEVSSDSDLSEAMGVMMRKVAVNYPSSMELTVVRRIYYNGVLDTVNSARQVDGTRLPTGTEYLSLGWFNPDAINPEPQHQVKIFGSVGPYWIHIPPGSDVGGSVDVQKTGRLEAGKEEQVMELRYGDARWMGEFPTNVHVTLSVMVKPLNDAEREELKKYPNFGEAFKIDE